MKDPTSLLLDIQKNAIAIISDFPDEFVYHNIKYFERLAKRVSKIAERSHLSPEDTETVLIAVWMLGVIQKEIKFRIKKKKLIVNIPKESYATIKAFFINAGYPDYNIEILIELLMEVTSPHPKPLNKREQVFLEALISDYSGKNAKKHLKQLHQELLGRNVELSKKTWHRLVLNHFSQVDYYTEYGKSKLKPEILQTLKAVAKNNKRLQREEDAALQKELKISDKEYKKLKKSLLSVKGRDERGIQTLFRTTSKNQYTLNAMVDRKAKIMITVNSIILTLLVGGVIGQEEFQDPWLFFPPTLLTVTCVFSIFFAVSSIRPNKSQGSFMEKEINGKEINLLYFGNFYNMPLREYERGIKKMIKEGDDLYGAMIKDIYFLGQTLNVKYRKIRISLNLFIIGFVVSVFSMLFIRLFFM